MFNRAAYIETLSLQKQEIILSSIYDQNDELIIFDIGSCEGENSIRYSRLYKNAIIYSFEPLVENHSLILKNIENYLAINIRPQNIALSDAERETKFYVSSGQPDNIHSPHWDFGNKSSSLLRPFKTLEIYKWLSFNKTINVPCTTIDIFCEKNGISEINFIHIDVQGAELLVLTGAQKMLANIHTIWLEVEAIELYQNQPLKAEIESFMEQHNFMLILDDVGSITGDQFWINKAIT